MILLFGMELSNYLSVSTSTSIVVDRSKDGDFLRIDFNMSFPSLSCEFASVDVSDVLGTNRFNITKTVKKFPIDPKLNQIGPQFHPGPVPIPISHGDEDHDSVEELNGGAFALTEENFDRVAARFPIFVVNFYAPWCFYSNRLSPSWEKAATIMAERYDPETDGRILLGKVDCTVHQILCRKHHIQGYPSIRIFRKGHDIRGEEHGHHDHESYYGERDTNSLVTAMESLVAPVARLALDGGINNTSGTFNASMKRPAPRAGGCRIEGFVKVKKVPGNLMISAHSGSHSFDVSTMNMTHYVSDFSFGRRLPLNKLKEVMRLTPQLVSQGDHLPVKVYVSEHENITHEHYLQVVKTEVLSTKFHESVLETYDYTVHSNVVQTQTIPTAKFHYELSPMQVLVKETPKSFSHFITNVCAIIGGVFTVAGIMDSMLHGAMRMMKKVELGKQF
ncbi:hypothetical protein KP509_33G019900 [Ceratopteris richardii]|nr:hypothetical protein KP509_33G019900 [Ceratopteris richardii]